MKKIYLATPYTGTPDQEEERFQEAIRITRQLIGNGVIPFSPIIQSHLVAKDHLPGDHGYWKKFNESWLEWADEVWVAKMHGWEQSRGVRWEVGYAKAAGMTVKFINHEDEK